MCLLCQSFLGAILNDQLRRIQTKQHNGTQRNPKKVRLLTKFSIDMTIHSQALSVHSLTSHLYVIMSRKKTLTYKLSSSKEPKTLQICHYRHGRKTTGVGFSFCNNFASLGFFARVFVPVSSIAT